MRAERAGAAALGLIAALLTGCGAAERPAPFVRGAPPPVGVRYLAGGDSRNDTAHVVPWAFAEAQARHASGFFFLGDMEISPELDDTFRAELPLLGAVPFFPVLGNHEVKRFGALSIGVAAAQGRFRKNFLGSSRTPVASALPDRVVYSVDLPGGVHFVALDNVTGDGFGKEQLAWLARDLTEARGRAATRHVVIGMHKALARNGVTTHSMDKDGAEAVADSDAALALFHQHRVSLVLQSHAHQLVKMDLGGIPAYITGGLGAPLDPVGSRRAFHHFLQLDVSDERIEVTVVRFEGEPAVETKPEEDE